MSQSTLQQWQLLAWTLVLLLLDGNNFGLLLYKLEIYNAGGSSTAWIFLSVTDFLQLC